MAREIIIDTETTGLDPRSGHRLIEIGCVEVEDFVPTGRTFHRYVHPDREIDPDAERIHGISLSFLADKPRFHEAEVCDAFLEFVGDSVLIAHNAPFDRSFINNELDISGHEPLVDSRWVDTLALAKKRFPGMYNSLDALCKRFKISLAERDKHGALVDARLLADVYLELQGGRERALDLSPRADSTSLPKTIIQVVYPSRSRPLAPRSTDSERAAHSAFIASSFEDNAIWLG
jgi:DNA polymerase-3 subunit epsilon